MDKQDDKQERVIPKLRFPEFQMELGWRKDDLGNLFTERKEKGYPNLPLLSLTEQNGIIPQAETNRKNNSSLDKSKYLRVCYGDIAYNTMRMWEGRSAFVNMEGIVSPAYTICTPKNNINSFFYSYYFKLPNLISEFHRYSQGLVKDTLNLKFDKFAQISVGVPPKPEEQQKIADCLSSIDELIELQEHQLAALKQHKKGLMQQLFPSHNDLQASKQAIVYPKLRFPQFKNCKGWEIVELNDIIQSLDAGISVNSSDNKPSLNNEFGILKTSCVTNGYFDVNENKVVLDEYEILRLKESVTKGSLIISRMNTPALVGSSAYVDEDYPNIFLPDRLWAAKPKKNKSLKFISFILSSDEGRSRLAELAGGTSNSMKNISKTALLTLQVCIPTNEEEQAAIIDCLSSLDKRIREENEQIDRLKIHKKGLMQRLFPNI